MNAPFAPLRPVLPDKGKLDDFDYPPLSINAGDLARFGEWGTDFHVTPAAPTAETYGTALWTGESREENAEAPADVLAAIAAFNADPRSSWLALFAAAAADQLREAEAKAAQARTVVEAISELSHTL